MEDARMHEDPSAADVAPGASVDPSEIEKFSKIAAEWWDPRGKFAPLHKFNPVRLGFIRNAACARFERDQAARAPFSGLKLLDVGCGGGLVAEPMARLGAAVTGIDASARNIAVAALHARQSGLSIDYRAASLETLAADGGGGFDIVLNLEAVEHAADPDAFLALSAGMVRPGGLMVVATINRTAKAFLLAKIGAEYVLGWLPRGTHDPRKFVKPEEATRALAGAELAVTEQIGVSYNPLMDAWRLTGDMDVNYMLAAVKNVD